ncbi:hypothetical protein DH2020_031344 [Rehmannia glutinosa]|uniref:HTH myb-type domain-containing protein n=1 Tax=Rehmannia glutinosa TaxID=99300 RepID=A0ABR0VLD9_REHGL
MLAVSPLRNPNNEREAEMGSFDNIEFPDFSSGNLLDSIDFDDLFNMGSISDGDLLPDLEMDPEILAEFSSENEKVTVSVSVSDVGSGSTSPVQGEEALSKKDEPTQVSRVSGNPSAKEGEKGRKSMSHAKNTPGKRKVKVDWTPELHRRFVQAVEQLGVDKAVPSRILELMGIDCLTRHNIASHLQRFPTPPVPGIPPPAMYKVEQAGFGVSTVAPAGQTLPQPPSDVHPSKESVDAAIGDVLSKPWLPLPLGLKPPSVDSVMVELQRQGISKVPPSCA